MVTTSSICRMGVLTLAIFVCVQPASAQSNRTQRNSARRNSFLTGGADPTIIAATRADGESGFFVVSTGRGISLSYSPDLKTWRRVGRVYQEDVPEWAKLKIPRSRGIWAPDISFHNGLYHLYYSVSSFGSQRSVIGLAVNKAIDPEDPDYEWTDRGMVIESDKELCDFNAIDPAMFVDRDGKWYLFWGSFWTGIKMVRLDPETGKPSADAEIVSIAGRPQHPTHAIEAPFVIFKDDFYYLFASWDRCCVGADSDYKVVIGRSKHVAGPYEDKDGRPMLNGGGTLVLAGNDRWRGPGHNSILTTDDGQWMAHHTYDVQRLRARRILQIRPLSWSDDGWPQVGDPINEP